MERYMLCGSDNYIWSTGDNIGHGSVGNVYLARHRKTGDKYAVKVFRTELKMLQNDYAKIELDVLRHIPVHENIIKIISLELQHRTTEKVIVMEYCEAGSLQHILDKPENYFGLHEEEFMSVFFQIGNALCHLHNHGIIHRDIKPGNILVCINQDNRYIYKIADFGTSKIIEQNCDSFSSITGTEEYLHPDMHRDLFIEKKLQGDYNSHVDLWSFGVMLYLCATGKLPFVPFKGVKNNKHTMQKLMRTMAPNVISQREMPDGTIFSSEHLPDECYLTSGTRKKTEEFLAVLFDLKRHITSKEFGERLHGFQKQIKLYIFDTQTSSMYTLYIDGKARLPDVKKAITTLTGVPIDKQLLIWDLTLLHDGYEARPIGEWLKSSEDKPLLVISSSGHPSHADYKGSQFILKTELPECTNDCSKWAKETCGLVYLLGEKIKENTNFQTHLVLSERLLRIMSYSVLNSTWKCVDIRRMMYSCSDNSHLDFKTTIMDNLSQRVCEDKFVSVCQELRCWPKAKKIIKDSEELFRAICDLSSKASSHNEYEINKYNKSELRRCYRRERNFLTRHCFKTTKDLCGEFDKRKREYFLLTDVIKRIDATVSRIPEPQLIPKMSEYSGAAKSGKPDGENSRDPVPGTVTTENRRRNFLKSDMEAKHCSLRTITMLAKELDQAVAQNTEQLITIIPFLTGNPN